MKPQSPDSFRMKVLDNLTTHTPPSSLVASFHLRDLYCYYRLCIDDPKKYYGFKPGLLGHSGSFGVDFSKLGMIEDDWKLESKEVSFLRRGLNLPVRPKEVEKVRIKETHQLEHKIQQTLFQHMAPSRHHGRKAYLLEDKQIPSVGVFDEVFLIWRAFGRITRDLLGSCVEEKDKTTDLQQQFLRLCSQQLETSTQFFR
ncbi:hypothetical protein Tco_1209921 [Tanacetum coccineum]